VANGITTVHLAYVREGTGHALIAARQWIPREHLEDPVKRRVMHLPPTPLGVASAARRLTRWPQS